MKRFILLITLCLLAVSVVVAQDEITLAYGDSYLGEFTNDNPSLTLGFDGAVGDVIYISVLDNNVSVDFRLLSPGGSQLAQANNGLLLNMELAAEGRYSIEFTRPNGSDEEGEFWMHLDRFEIESLTETDEGWTLFVEGNLPNAAALRQFNVDLEEGDMVTIQYYGSNLGIIVEDPSGEIVVMDGMYDNIDVPLYRISTSGTYIVTLLTAEPEGTDIGFWVFKREVIEIAINEPITVEIEENLPTVVAFDTPASKMWDINAILPQEGSRFIAIYQFSDDRAPWEAQIANDSGSGPEGQPRIRPFIPSEEGTYYIALWYDAWNTDYETYEGELMVSPSTLLSIPNNSPLTGKTSNETGIAQYAYSGKAGDEIRVSFAKLSKDGVLSLSIYSVEDEVITFTGRNAMSSSFTIQLPLDGFYQFVIHNASYDDLSILDFEILVEPVTK